MHLIQGRLLTAADVREASGVALVDETLARRFWPAGNPLGRHLRWVRTNERIEIVGVVGAVRHYGLAALPRETVYRPYAQYAAMPEMFVEARSPNGYDTARTAIVEEVRRLDPDQPVAELGRVEALVEASLGQPRFNAALLAVFAAIALLLAAIGIYGVMAFSVSERTQEIGVRMALGADPASVRRLIVRDGAAMTSAGVGAGTAGAAVAAQALRSLLFGVTPWDPAIFASVPLALAAIAMIASYCTRAARRRARPNHRLATRVAMKTTCAFAAAVVAAVLTAGAHGADGPYQFIKDVEIGGEGGWDYLNLDGAAKRLLISHGTKVVVFDLTKDALAGEIADTPGVHGAVVAGDYIFTSNGRENKASMVDVETLQTVKKIDTEGNPDFIMYEPKMREVYTFNGAGKSASVISANGSVVATIPSAASRRPVCRFRPPAACT